MSFFLNHSLRNPRNSEGSFIRLSDGQILLAYTRYHGKNWQDSCPADIASCISPDGGIHWVPGSIIVKHKAMNVMSVSLLRLQDGRIAMVYLEKSSGEYSGVHFIDCRPKIIFSSDEAETWSDPIEIVHLPPVYICVNNDRLIQLKSGRLLLPGACHRYGKNASLKEGIGIFFYSDDNGRNWEQSSLCCYPPSWLRSGFGLQEPGVIELADGRVMAWFRTNAGCQYKTFSADQGNSWSELEPAVEFLSPESPLSMKRDPNSGDLFAVWNDYHPSHSVQFDPICSWGRTPLVLSRSKDEGKTWHVHSILENSPLHGFAYTAMLFNDNHLLLEYCCGSGANGGSMLQDCKIRTVAL